MALVILATLAGQFFQEAMRKLKGVLFLGSLGFAIFMLSAPFWNANDKWIPKSQKWLNK